MTEQHPLTDDRCDDIAPWRIGTSDTCDNMRAATDWQLERLIDWLSVKLNALNGQWHPDLAPWIDVDCVIEDLREAMRPTTTQEDN